MKKKALVALVLKQEDKWPTKSFNASKTNVPIIRAALLNPIHGFTTELPMPASRNTQDDTLIAPAAQPVAQTPIAPIAQPVAQPQTPDPRAEHMNSRNPIPVTPILQRMNGVLPPTPVSLDRPSIIHTFATNPQPTQPADPFPALSFVTTSSNQVHGTIKRVRASLSLSLGISQ